MKIVEAVRYLSIYYLDACKKYMDEDSYEDAKLIIDKFASSYNLFSQYQFA